MQLYSCQQKRRGKEEETNRSQQQQQSKRERKMQYRSSKSLATMVVRTTSALLLVLQLWCISLGVVMALVPPIPASSTAAVTTGTPPTTGTPTTVVPTVSRRNAVQSVIAAAAVATTTTITMGPFGVVLPKANAILLQPETTSNLLSTATTTTIISSSEAPPAPLSSLLNTKAPTFELPNSRGNGVTSLSQLTSSKKWTVLYFYPGAFTQGCTLEARGFQRDMEEYRRLNAQIVGVSVDPPEKNAQFCSAEGLDFYMLSDTGGRVSKLYGSALSIPGFGSFSNRQTYIIDPNGTLKWIFTDVERRIAQHSNEVLEKLSELENQQNA